ncbi:MAG TPA: SDR family oxidoreductase [Opitutus sp.]|nr:SDR family oxidoreductase [Opitutus sp.]
MAPPLSSQIALVTGGAKGFGRGIAAALRAAGARVYITGRDQSALAAAARDLDVAALTADATSPGDWDRVLARVVGDAGRIDILVNNAGGGVKIAPTEEQTDESIAAAIALNLTSALYGCRRVAPLLRRQRSGTIVNLSSSCAHHAWPGWGIYGAAKAGLNQFSKSLYLELREHGVRVTTISPSWGATQFTDAAGLGARDPAVLAQSIQPSELGRLVVEICTLPPHLCVQETILWPMVQEVNPL